MPRHSPVQLPSALILTLASALFSPLQAAPVSLDTITGAENAQHNHQAYIKVEGGYQPLEPIEGKNHLDYDFSSRLFQLPVIENAVQPLTLLVLSETVKPEWMRFETRHLDMLGVNNEVQTRVARLEESQHEIILAEPMPEDRVLLVDLGWLETNIYGVAIADPALKLEVLYAPDTDHNPVSAEYTLGMMANRPGAPQTIKDLHRYWVGRIEQDRAAEYFGYIEESWQEYESAEAAADRFKALEDVKAMSETYLEDFQTGREREQVSVWLRTATEKLGSI